jgi:formate-dependent phosphoribosylglycinamide formyltransferase (GAR transformylase)
MTRIGTPLSPSALKVMFLGAGELGKEVIIALQRWASRRSPSIATRMRRACRSRIVRT